MANTPAKQEVSSVVEKWLKFMAQSEAKDKVMKNIQYGARVISWYLKYMKYDSSKDSVANRLAILDSQTATARKLFRVAKPIDYIQIIYKIFAQRGINLTYIDLLQLGRALGNLVYFGTDHIIWLIKIGVIKGNANKLNEYSGKGWFWALVFWLIHDADQLIKSYQREVQLKKKRSELRQANTVPNTEELENIDRQLQQLKGQQSTLWNTTIYRTITDLQIAAAMSGYWNLSPAILGICGISSATSAGIQLWQKI